MAVVGRRRGGAGMRDLCLVLARCSDEVLRRSRGSGGVEVLSRRLRGRLRGVILLLIFLLRGGMRRLCTLLDSRSSSSEVYLKTPGKMCVAIQRKPRGHRKDMIRLRIF